MDTGNGSTGRQGLAVVGLRGRGLQRAIHAMFSMAPTDSARCPVRPAPSAHPLLLHSLRKDPLDPIDNGTKVAILFKRMTDPEIMKREEEAKKKREEAAAKAKAEGKADRPTGAKAGAWAGLPPRR